MSQKHSRRALLSRAFKVAAVGVGGLAMGVSSAAPADACAIMCTYLYTDNVLGSSCHGLGVFRCRSACGGSFRYCTNRYRNFCLSRNEC